MKFRQDNDIGKCEAYNEDKRGRQQQLQKINQ